MAREARAWRSRLETAACHLLGLGQDPSARVEGGDGLGLLEADAWGSLQGFLDPLKDPTMEPPKMSPITTLGKLGDYWEVPFSGSLRGVWVCKVRPRYASRCFMAIRFRV